jgi:catechol 2,3-dioxygenase-like lactoylglutathione lyase family enzyme
MFSHVTIGTDNMNRAMRFYDAVLGTVGFTRHRTAKIAIGYAPRDFVGVNAPFWVVRPYDKAPAAPGNGPMVAFEAATRAAVDSFHAAALAAGGSDEGPPGLRAHYHPNYYGAYVRDPDGNKLCAVCHEPVESASG